MAIFKPFSALRPKTKYASATLCPPYDVVTHKEASDICNKNPASFMHVIRADAAFPEEEQYSDKVYHQARKTLQDFETKGILFQEEKPSYYIYSQTMKGRTQTGIVGCCSIDDYQNGIIKRHEVTRKEKEQDRIQHFDICDANTEPVFLIYRNNTKLSNLIQHIVTSSPPVYDVVQDACITHRLWVVNDRKYVAEFEQYFDAMAALYIADGHHRTASAVSVGLKRRIEHPDFDGTEEFNRFMAVAFPDDCLKVLDYNRIVKDLNGLTPAMFLHELQKSFIVTCMTNNPNNNLYNNFDVFFDGVSSNSSDCSSCGNNDGVILPIRKNTFSMYLDRNWYRLELRQPLSPVFSKDPVKSLDVSILQHLVLGPILGIDNPRTNSRISFIGGVKGANELMNNVDSGKAAVAFAVYPVTIEQIMTVADASTVMPPKSTWFEPKLGSGWFIHKLK